MTELTKLSEVTPNESYLLKQNQRKIAASFAGFLHDIRNAVGFVTPAADNPDASLTPSGGWRINNQQFVFLPGDTYAAQIIFDNVRWDSERSDIDYGPKHIEKKLNESVKLI